MISTERSGPGPARRRRAGQAFEVGLLIPVSGSMGMFGPSSLACARLACELWNEAGGAAGRPVQCTVLDAGETNAALTSEVDRMLVDGRLDALVMLSTTAVCRRVSAVVDARVPLVFTTQFEGEGLPGWVHAIGETPDRQLLPAIDWMAQRFRARRWFLVGNDYCWPRRSHRAAARRIRSLGGETVAEHYLPLGGRDFDPVIEQIERLRPDVVLLSLIGSDAVHMGRCFGRARLHESVLRLSVSVEENALLGMGGANTHGMFASSGYFAAVASDANMAFKERYHQRFGDRAPTLNSLAQSVYEGFVHLHRQWTGGRRQPGGALRSVRALDRPTSDGRADPIFLAQADGLALRVIQPLGAAP